MLAIMEVASVFPTVESEVGSQPRKGEKWKVRASQKRRGQFDGSCRPKFEEGDIDLTCALV